LKEATPGGERVQHSSSLRRWLQKLSSRFSIFVSATSEFRRTNPSLGISASKGTEMKPELQFRVKKQKNSYGIFHCYIQSGTFSIILNVSG
jgi:hypothetical protein